MLFADKSIYIIICFPKNEKLVFYLDNYCPYCGKRITEHNAQFCSSCGAKLPQSFSEPYNDNYRNIRWRKSEDNSLPPAAGTIMSLNDVAGVLCLIIGIFFLITGFFTLIVFVGFVFLAFALVNFLIRSKLKEINELIKQRKFVKAKNEQLTWMILGFLLGGIITGIILLIGYIKYDDFL